MPVPTCRAVWKPKVKVSCGRSRSLSIVLGTWTTASARPFFAASSASLCAEKQVSSPPMLISLSMCSVSRLASVASSSAASFVGLARAMPRCDPPRKWIHSVLAASSCTVCAVSPFINQE
jgi:hypothetical protein